MNLCIRLPQKRPPARRRPALRAPKRQTGLIAVATRLAIPCLDSANISA
jgi:hypothetical protein